MLERFGARLQGLLVLAMLLAGAWAWWSLPDGRAVPLHFSADGTVDRWGSPGLGFFLLPGIGLGLLGLRWLLPRIDPRGDNLRKSGKALATIWLAVTLLLALLQAQIIGVAFGLWQVRPLLPMALIGGLLVVMGNVMGKLRANYTVGIRTPWTLADERVWDQTHRFGGKAFVLAGALLLLLSLSSLPARWQAPAITTACLGAAALSVARSYWLWRQRRAD